MMCDDIVTDVGAGNSVRADNACSVKHNPFVEKISSNTEDTKDAYP
jgi:formylmethanofuran dehydrogenase subunit B